MAAISKSEMEHMIFFEVGIEKEVISEEKKTRTVIDFFEKADVGKTNRILEAYRRKNEIVKAIPFVEHDLRLIVDAKVELVDLMRREGKLRNIEAKVAKIEGHISKQGSMRANLRATLNDMRYLAKDIKLAIRNIDRLIRCEKDLIVLLRKDNYLTAHTRMTQAYTLHSEIMPVLHKILTLLEALYKYEAIAIKLQRRG